MLYRALLLALAATVRGWNQCEGPDVNWMALDEGVGKSASYAAAAMNGNMYSGGYTKGNFAFVGVTDGVDVNPVPSATLWGDTTSDAQVRMPPPKSLGALHPPYWCPSLSSHTCLNRQNLYVAEVNSIGSMTKGWLFKGSAIQQGALGHGAQTNSIDYGGGLHAMVDGAHLAVKGSFRQLLTLPDGTVWSSALMSNGDTRNPPGQVPFVLKLDVSNTTGVGTGTTGWAKMMDDGYPGGVSLSSIDGDAGGNMIVSFTGCATWDATFENGNDRYGRPQPPGKGTDCTHNLRKLAAADGAVMWTKAIPHTLHSCRAITDGSFFCGWTMAASDGTLDFENGITVDGVDDTAGIIKYNGAGVAQWAKATHTTSFSVLEVSHDGTLLAYYGRAESSTQVSRIDTSAGNEGNILWTDTDSGVGTHGFRDIAVTHDGREVLVYGQISGGEGDTMTDATGSSMTLRSRGVSDIFVACFDASTGAGKWALDGGGSDTEYFLGGIVADPSTNDIYVAGYTRCDSSPFAHPPALAHPAQRIPPTLTHPTHQHHNRRILKTSHTTCRSEFLHWGDVKRKNVMYEMNSVTAGTQGLGHSSTPVGSNKALVTKIKSTTSLPSCLNSCTAGVGLGIQASDVKSGYCFIDRHCYAEGEASPYADQGCKKCDPTAAAGRTAWSAPDTTSMCFIGDKCIAEGAHGQVVTGQGRYGPTYSDDPCSKCIPSASGTAYSPVAENGCMVSTTHALAQRPCRPDTMSFAALAVRSWTWPLSKRRATTTKGRSP